MMLRSAKRFVLPVLLALLVNFSAEAKQGNLVTDLIDAEIALMTPKVESFQAGYIQQAGKGNQYYQMLWSHNSLPADGVTKTADNLNAKPTDRPDIGAVLWQEINLTNLSRYRIRVDNYDGPKGKGYVVIYQVEVTKGLWQRSVNFGPETRRNEPWHIVAPEDQ